ncbi:transporter substrate-binding domain-containing protein [Nitratireductor sp. ZSWI3]|uniref:transporter substrate-binding domain-containing protein n=1 Tax=Nitratireductor sp. ZSWI3 TaxID=2966359 RepID=UPI00214FC038|nr:transporter substrate-binding domain-containing protein [Nitratireductor sp. ZSWI3]MCR4268034.1 transporter substrate-binding domain-containing protein [Nitratireductor sp. ZSWI3]
MTFSRRGFPPENRGTIRSRGLRCLGLLILFLAAATLADTQEVAAQPEPSGTARSVNVGVYVSRPFVTEQAGGYDGMAIDLWEKIAGNLGLATHYVAYPTIRALVDATRSGEIDAAVTNLTITHDRAEAISFTQPWYDAGLRIMVLDQAPAGFWSVVTGLSNAGHLRAYAWLAFVIVLSTIVLTFFDRRFDKDFPRRWREGIAESFYHVMSVATSGKTARKNLFGWKGRVWSALWMVCGVAVVAYITSSVTSVMTAVSIEQGINSLADLPGRTPGVFTGSTAEDYLNEIGIGARSYSDIDEAVAALQAGRIDAIVADAPILEYHAHTHPEQKTAVVGSLFHPDKYGFAFPHDSDLTRQVTLQILDLQEDGAIEDLRLKYFGSSQ